MKIDTELELRYDYELLVKMYNLCDKIAADTYATPSGRDAEWEGVRAAIRKMEREIVAFHLAHPDRIDLPQPCVEATALPEMLEKAA